MAIFIFQLFQEKITIKKDKVVLAWTAVEFAKSALDTSRICTQLIRHVLNNLLMLVFFKDCNSCITV